MFVLFDPAVKHAQVPSTSLAQIGMTGLPHRIKKRCKPPPLRKCKMKLNLTIPTLGQILFKKLVNVVLLTPRSSSAKGVQNMFSRVGHIRNYFLCQRQAYKSLLAISKSPIYIYTYSSAGVARGDVCQESSSTTRIRT